MFVDPVALISIIVQKVVSATVSPVDSSPCKSFVSLSTIDKPNAETTKEESGDEE